MTNMHTDNSDQGFVLGNKVLAAEVFAKNGFLVLSSDTGEERTSEVNADQSDQGKEDEDTLRGVLLTRACRQPSGSRGMRRCMPVKR